MSITLIVSLVLASSGLCMALVTLARARMPARRLHPDAERKPWTAGELARVAASATLSPALVLVATYLFQDRLFQRGAFTPAYAVRGALSALAILGLYDWLYYLMHRHLFHGWSVLRRVHAVHHRVRQPVAIDSLYVHPVENVLGLSLLMLCTWIVGPVDVYAFGGCFFLYSWLNIVVHAGVALPFPYLGLIARKHDAHHAHMRAGNYASLSPLPDLVFGTAE